MVVDCLHEPGIIAFAKTFGASIGIFGAALASSLTVGLTKQVADFRSDAFAKLSHAKQSIFRERTHAGGRMGFIT